MPGHLKAIFWDFGGVITGSPFEAFNRFEAEKGYPKDFIRSVNARGPDTNAWAQLERSEINAAQFDRLFRAESRAMGHEISGSAVLALLSGAIRPKVVEALKICKSKVKIGCITNNAPIGKGASMTSDPEKAAQAAEIMALFEHVLESSKLGLRKPDPKIYALMCEALSVSPADCLYIDDLGINLKPARAMGMTTLKAVSEDQLLVDLAQLTGFEGII